MTAGTPALNKPLRTYADAKRDADKAARTREWLEHGGIRCPASPARRRCSHSYCIANGCPLEPVPEGDGASVNFERTT